MAQLIIHPGTGTVIDRDECLVLDYSQLPERLLDAIIMYEDVDDQIVALAQKIGVPILREI
jgi:hypothetical protein